MAARALDKELNSAAVSAASKIALTATEVTDLTGMVKRRKKTNPELTVESNPEPLTNGLKRKSPEESDAQSNEKRPKLSDSPSVEAS
jgi:hypothetical protein